MNAPSPNLVLDAALAYAARGWRVFPCDPRPDKPFAKRPLVVADKDSKGETIPKSGWPKKATTDEATIRAWWKRWPKALIGMAPGWAGGYVIDLDPKGESVEEVEARLEAALGAPLPAGPRTVTQSGGRHCWFRRPAGEAIPNDPPGLKNIDIRCDNGYVILPPSVMLDGRAYAWEGEAFDPATAPELPAALLDLIASRKQRDSEEAPRPAAAPARVTGGSPGEDAVRRYARAALDRIGADVAGALQGHRGSDLFAAACAAGRFVGTGAVSEREALAVLEDGAERCGLMKDDGPKRVRREIARGLDEGRADCADTKARLDGIAREAEEKAVRYGRRAAPVPDDRPQAPIEAYADEAQRDDGGAPAAAAPAPQPQQVDSEQASTLYDDGGRPYDDEDAAGPSDGNIGARPPGSIDFDKVRECAPLDHSDTDNAKRFITHFGENLVVLETEGVVNTDYFTWAGTHWDMAGGNDSAIRLGKKVGGLIALEADFLTHTPQEARAIEDGEQAARDLVALEKTKAEWTDVQKLRAKQLEAAIDAGKDARAALDKRQVSRRKFGISSKNKPRIHALRDLAACDLTRKPAAFDADPLKLATATHTLRFTRAIDPECPDPDTTRWRVRCEAVAGHNRGDLITKLIPVAYDPQATCPRFIAFMQRFLPSEAVRRFVQMGAGLGLLGLPVQKVFFHYGNGANGKSVFLETLVRVFGALAASLPTEAIIGTGERQGGQASPELARLFNVRFVRVLELPANEPLKEAIVKKLTGGEAIPVRNLFKGYFDFQPVFIAHMSGNGYPRIDGTDNGIWRRIAVIHWPVTLEEHEQRDFEEVVKELVAEAPGILNWLIEGALAYLRDGLVTPAEVKAATQEYRDEMDKIGSFITACVEMVDDAKVPAAEMYAAYVAWAADNGVKAIHQTTFGRDLKKRIPRDDSGQRRMYLGCRLHDVPRSPDAPRNPDSRWGREP